jgi:hypothetical protein
MVVGVALEAWDPSDPDGQVLIFVNRGFHDSDLFITATGNISVIEEQDELTQLSRFTIRKDDEEVKRVGLFSDVFTASLSAGLIDAREIRVNGVNILDLINTVGDQAASPAATSELSGILDEVNGLKDLSLKAQSDIEQLKNTQAQIASETAFLRDILENGSGSVLGASDSASLDQAIANLDISGSAIVGDDLTVLGRTTLSDLGVTGSLTAGIIGIDGLKGEINTVGEALKIQSLSAAPVDFMDGKVVIETTGNIITKGTIKAKKLLIDEADAAEKSVGEGTIEAGETTVVIETAAVSSSSKVFLTPTSDIDVPLVVSSTSAGNSFTVKISKSQAADTKFNWFIVN